MMAMLPQSSSHIALAVLCCALALACQPRGTSALVCAKCSNYDNVTVCHDPADFEEEECQEVKGMKTVCFKQIIDVCQPYVYKNAEAQTGYGGGIIKIWKTAGCAYIKAADPNYVKHASCYWSRQRRGRDMEHRKGGMKLVAGSQITRRCYCHTDLCNMESPNNETNEEDGNEISKDGNESDKDGNENYEDGNESDKDGNEGNKDGNENYEDGNESDKDGNESNPPDTVTNPPDAVTNPPDAVTNPPDAVTNPPDVVTNPPDAVTNPPDAVTNPPDVVTNPPDAVTNPPDAVTNAPDTATNATANETNVARKRRNATNVARNRRNATNVARNRRNVAVNMTVYLECQCGPSCFQASRDECETPGYEEDEEEPFAEDCKCPASLGNSTEDGDRLWPDCGKDPNLWEPTLVGAETRRHMEGDDSGAAALSVGGVFWVGIAWWWR